MLTLHGLRVLLLARSWHVQWRKSSERCSGVCELLSRSLYIRWRKSFERQCVLRALLPIFRSRNWVSARPRRIVCSGLLCLLLLLAVLQQVRVCFSVILILDYSERTPETRSHVMAWKRIHQTRIHLTLGGCGFRRWIEEKGEVICEC